MRIRREFEPIEGTYVVDIEPVMAGETDAGSSSPKHLSLHSTFGGINANVWLVGAAAGMQNRVKPAVLELKTHFGPIDLKLVSISARFT